MKHLVKFGKVKPILFHGKLISIKVTLTVKGYKGKTIIFKDSMLLIPQSLRQLCDSFKVDNKKGIFPILLNDINYKGPLPDYELFKSISKNEYLMLKDQFVKKMWSFKDEAIKYCKLDCISLYQVLTKFNELIYNEFKVDPSKALTLPSLAMRIYKTLYLPNYHSTNQFTVYQLNGLPEHNIRQSYTGGAVDVYIPQNKDNEILYLYDVNNLYPSVMLNKPMPIGQPVAFLGDIRKVNVNAFGFFYCKITSPEYLEHPILQRTIKISNGLRTIAGLGSWMGWVFSEEMDNAMKYGYTFEILHGYQFEKGYIYKDYITKMYDLRLQYPKGEAMNLNAKLLMNSLYGKFGMKSDTTKIEIISIKDLNKYLEKFNTNIADIIYLEDHIVVTINTNEFIPSSDILYYDSEITNQMDVNIAIASAITAYGRIHMSQFKNNPNYKLYYSDTDCAVLNTLLPAELVGPGLGQMKLEHVITKGIFLAPKVYALITNQGEQIIKAKGLNKDVIQDINMADFEFLLSKDSSKILKQSKLSKSLYNSDIELINTIYTLKVTSNKRQNIYIKGIFDSTKPLNYNNLSPSGFR